MNPVIASSPLGLCAINTEGVYELWNPLCEKLLGYPADEIIGRPHHEVAALMAVDGDTIGEDFWPIRPARDHGERVLRRLRRDGSVVTLGVAYAPIKTEADVLAGHVCVINDLTERRQIELQLQQAQRMEAIGRLTGGIAHDFNNLLSVMICNLAFVIEDAQPGSEILDCGRAALAAAQRGAELIQLMLSFARKQHLESRVVDVNGFVHEMGSRTHSAMEETTEVAVLLQSDLWPALADPVQLEIALTNLVANAREATSAGGKVSIETANSVLSSGYVQPFADLAPGDYVMITVSDTGRGMSSDTLARAFDPFFTTKAAGEGVGLGLSMVFGFAQQSSGHVCILSEPAQGTQVKLYLPRSANDAMSRPQPVLHGPLHQQATILIVEDNKALAAAVERILKRAGYTTIIAHDARAALEVMAGSTVIDMLFTDITLGGGMDGIEVATAATAKRPGLRVLFTSGFAEKAVAGPGHATVASRFLPKPYEADELLDSLSRAFEDR